MATSFTVQPFFIFTLRPSANTRIELASPFIAAASDSLMHCEFVTVRPAILNVVSQSPARTRSAADANTALHTTMRATSKAVVRLFVFRFSYLTGSEKSSDGVRRQEPRYFVKSVAYDNAHLRKSTSRKRSL